MKNGFTLLTVAAVFLFVGARAQVSEPERPMNGPLRAGQEPSAAARTAEMVPRLVDIQIVFKLDPRLTRGLYMGERWVSPPTYSTTGTGKTVIVEARAFGLDARGSRAKISPQWNSADPQMVTVSPSEGNDVTITVQRDGEGHVQVTSHGISKELAIRAAYRDPVIQVEISQKAK